MPVPNSDLYTRGWSLDGEIALLPLADGTRLRYLKTGTGPVLVLLHTLRTQLDYFQRLVPLVTSRFTVYAVDYPGLGWSEIRPGASYEEPALREAIVEFVTALGLTDVTLAGDSMGGTLALTASTELGARVRQVVAINTYDYPQGVERANLLASLVIKAMRVPGLGLIFSKLSNPPILGGIMRGGFFDPKRLPADFVLEQLRSGKRAGYAAVETRYLRALPSYQAARGLYGRVAAPVTLIYGDHDWSKPDEREEVARLVPGSKLITLRDTGHFASLERPTEIARILIDGAVSAPANKSQRRRNVAGGAP
jgi:pimeloyl-ACP methyl ester carboxylesterase